MPFEKKHPMTTHRSRSSTNSTFQSLVKPPTSAAAANNAEHNLTLRQAIRLYPKAIMWSVLLSTALVMEGFDNILLANLFAYGPFKRQFGERQENGSYELDAAWQSGLSNGVLAGEIFGLFAAGVVSERVGYRKTLLGALALTMGCIFIVFFSETMWMLLVGEIALGVPLGVFQTLTTAYAAEVCPGGLRAYLTTYVNACWVFGQLLASIVLRVMVNRDDKWGYKIPFALQWFWPVPIAIFVYLAPESPWWLVRKERLREARLVLQSLRRKLEDLDDGEFETSIESTLELMIKTNEREKEVQSGTSYKDCLKHTDRRRTEIACMCWVIQTLCGSTFMGYSTYFYEQAGLAAKHAFTMSLVQFSLGLIGVLISWVLMARFGRRTLYLVGEFIMLICLLAIGTIALVPTDGTGSSAKWAIAALLLVFTLVYDATVGPICYSLVSEIPSTRLRSKTIVLARNCYNISGIVTNIVTPQMLNPTTWGWGAKAASSGQELQL
ncbi:general substrate transporter [Lophiotrema nucula]|uniref:General substrate transporter n=1 Tax=Lophiotrema nucula TaxID=690887 RepID=A0A6A5ZJ04_9PLEO|nr:general substrate transporter [Lophiotrema nucula]